MFPIRDANPTHKTPKITIAIIAICAVVYGYEFILEASGSLNEFLQIWAIVPRQLLTRPFTEFFTLFTAMFLHGGISHLGGNMLYLWIFGDNIEDKLGMGRFIIFYLVCGLIASFAQIIVSPNSNVPNIGASGAIAGVLGGYLVLFPRARVTTIIMYFSRQLPAFIVLGGWFAMQLFQGVGGLAGAQDANTGGVAFFAHIGGFVAGMVLIKLFMIGRMPTGKVVERPISPRPQQQRPIQQPPRTRPEQQTPPSQPNYDDVDIDNLPF